ncbi:hypothetical protein BDZ45DRAFT_676977 [Acephala macrosclerotiorum]|nr:hypothetical protein BDZ45DRAFT_676977 [Acephala macrosclerotiorum]
MTSTSGPSMTLGTSTGQNSFPQTGAWNMLDLSKLPVQATLGVLSRYSAARVNPYTALVGEVLCHNFQLTTKGRRNVEAVVKSLKVVGSLGDTLEFGFGIEDVVRSMVKSERGCVCLALCAALMDCYSEDMAVEVLIEMANLTKVDGQYMPSSESWKELLRACAGALSASKFPVVAEHFMQLNKEEQRLGAYRGFESLPTTYRGCSSPKSIAKALLALSQISRNEMQSVTLLGGADVGWLAAMADWLLDLRTQIIQPDGEVFYTNCESAKIVQVQVMYMGTDGTATNSVQTVGKTYYLDDASKLFKEEGRLDAAVVSGRVAWKKLLGSTFLSDFKKLMEITHTFGELLGSAARLFKALALADKSIPETYRLACISYCDASYGSGFVTNTLRWFPELQALKEDMQKASSVDLATARRTYEACISAVRSHCDCRTCRSSTCHPEPVRDTEMTPAPDELQDDGNDPDSPAFGVNSEDAESLDDWDPDRFCLVIMVETIISTSRALSNVVIEQESLFPVRSGLELAYGRQLNQRRAATAGGRAIKEIGPISFCLDFDNNFSFGTQSGNEEGVEVRLHNVLELFAGRRPPSINSNSSAICLHGLCAFLGILQEPNEDRNSVARIHVIAGRILFETKSYPRLVDRVDRLDNQDVKATFSSALGIVTSKDLCSKKSLSVRERSTGLECLLEIDICSAEGHSPVQVGPSHLAVLLASRRGIVSCKLTMERIKLPGKRCGTRHSATRQLGDLEEAMAKEAPLQVNGKKVLALNCQGADRAITAIASAAYLDPKYSFYVVDRECLDCCLKAALAVDRPERSHFCFFILP